MAVRTAWLVGMKGTEERGVEWWRGEATEDGSEFVVAAGKYGAGAAEGSRLRQVVLRGAIAPAPAFLVRRLINGIGTRGVV